jgi:PadR family transcriptional regulator, regulatory protein PadR
MQPIRVTLSVAAVMRVFLDEPDRQRYGYELMKATGFASGKLYPILARLERAKWIERLEPSSADSGGPPRVGYRISPDAVVEVRQELAAVLQMINGSKGQRNPVTQPKWVGG